MWVLILSFHMGHMGDPPGIELDTISTVDYDNKKQCELAGALVKSYFHAEATENKPNGEGYIKFSCVEKTAK